MSITGGTMQTTLEKELDSLQQLLLTMGGETEHELERAVDALVGRDSALADEVIAGDVVLDQREMEVDRRVVELIVREEPKASDLRLVITTLKVAPCLERVADHAVNIAQQALKLNRVPPLKAFITVPRMAETAMAMVRDGLAAFVRRDSALAREVIARDDRVDAMHEEISRELLTYAMADPGTIPRVLALSLVAHSLERVADQGVNIAEYVVFLVEGEDIRHRQEQRGGEP
jgi:phosphate transport system protein